MLCLFIVQDGVICRIKNNRLAPRAIHWYVDNESMPDVHREGDLGVLEGGLLLLWTNDSIEYSRGCTVQWRDNIVLVVDIVDALQYSRG